MINEMIESGTWLPYVFAFLMGFSMLVYGLLDGYDLGVGILSGTINQRADKDAMIASIGPFWDANETWLVLGVGILLVAFPKAHGVILGHLYLPVFVMLIGLIFRGVAFDFRSKSQSRYHNWWDRAFSLGSLVTALAQGYMLGFYIVGFDSSLGSIIFSCLVSIGVAIGYCLIGANWLIMKTEGELQKKSIWWAKLSLYGAVACIFLVSVGTPAASFRIFEKWFAYPNIFYLSPIPVITGIFIFLIYTTLQKLPKKNDQHCWVPFVLTIGIAVMCFIGLAYSFFPFIVPNEMLIIQAAAARSSLLIILVGALIVLPILIGYTFIAYRVFHGKSTSLRYD